VDAAGLVFEPDFGLLFVGKVFKKIGFGKQIFLSGFGRSQTDGNFGFGYKLIKSPTLDIFSQSIIRVYNDLIEINDAGEGLEVAFFGLVPDRLIVVSALNSLPIQYNNEVEQKGAISSFGVIVLDEGDEVLELDLNRDVVDVFEVDVGVELKVVFGFSS
jgi:hypothetical protein